MTSVDAAAWVLRDIGTPALVSSNGAEVSPGGNQRRLLAILGAKLGAPSTVDQLIDELWGDFPPNTAVASLRNTVSRLRRQCANADPCAPDPIESTTEAYALSNTVSLAETLRDASAGGRQSLLRQYPRILTIEPYTGVSSFAVDVERERIRLVQRDIAFEIVEERYSVGDISACANLLLELTAVHCYDEGFWLRRIAVAQRVGGEVAQSKMLKEACTVLSDVVPDPGPRLSTLLNDVWASDPAEPTPLPIGRHDEARYLLSALGERDGTTIAIEAPPGYGKSHLLEWLTRTSEAAALRCRSFSINEADAGAADAWCSRAGLAVADQQTSDYSVSVGVDEAIPAIVEALWKENDLLVVDDFHWAGSTSRAVVTQLSKRARIHGGLLIVATRSVDHDLAEAELVRLEGWTERNIAEVLTDCGGTTSRAANILSLSAGVPLLASTLARARSTEVEFPTVVRQQLTNLRTPEQAVIRTLAVASHPIELPRLARLFAIAPAEVTRLADAGIASGLLRRDGLQISTIHDIVAHALTDSLDSEAERSIRQKLGSLYRDELNSDDSQTLDLAIRHFTEAFQLSPDANAGRDLLDAIERAIAPRWRRGDHRHMLDDLEQADAVLASGIRCEAGQLVALRLAAAACHAALGDQATSWTNFEQASRASAESTELISQVASAILRRNWASAPVAIRGGYGEAPTFRSAARRALKRGDASPVQRAELHLGLAFDADQRGDWNQIAPHTSQAREALPTSDSWLEVVAGLLELRSSADRPEMAKERLELARSIHGLARSIDDGELRDWSHWLVAVAEGCVGEFHTYRKLAQRVPSNERETLVVDMCQSLCATVTGDRSVPYAPALFMNGMSNIVGLDLAPDPAMLPPSDAGSNAVAMVALRAIRGHPRALSEVRAITSRLDQYRDFTWAIALAFASTATWVVDDAQSAASLMPALFEVRGVAACPTISTPPFYGSMELHLATAAATSGDVDLALDCLDRADHFHAKAGLSPFVRRSDLQRADLASRQMADPRPLLEEREALTDEGLAGYAEIATRLLERFEDATSST